MHALYQKFITSICWNTTEAVWFHTMLMAHKYLLFQTVDRATYGTIGIVFGIVYASATVINYGLDQSLGAAWRTITQNKTVFKQFAAQQLYYNYSISIALGMLALLTKIFFYPHIDTLITISIILCVVVENIKKTCKTMLHLAFANTITTTGEIAHITAYLLLFWLLALSGLPISLHTAIVPLLVCTLGSTLYFVHQVYRLYCSLPSASYPKNRQSFAGSTYFMRNRLFNWLHQINRQLCSGNVLVPYVAYHWGIEHAALFKITSDIVHGVTTIAQSIVGNASNAALSSAKQEHISAQTILFARMVRASYYCIGILLCLATGGIVATHVMNGQAFTYHYSYHSIWYIYGIITLAETSCLVYEKRYMIQEKMHLVVYCNILLYSLVGLLYYSMPSVSLMLIGIASARLVTYLIVPLISPHLHKVPAQ